MKRDEVLQTYRVVSGRIRSPGKFECAPIYAPAFHDRYLDGWWDREEDDGRTVYFTLGDDDRAAWPELANAKEVWISEDDQGFVDAGIVPRDV